MKKLIFLLLAITGLLGVSSCTQQPGLTLTPSEVTIKVGEKVQLQPGAVGEGIDIMKVVRIEPEDEIAYFDNYYNVVGLKEGTTRVGIGIPEDRDGDGKTTLEYEAYTVVHVVEK